MIVTRFAPSPTGYLHLGHAHSALVGWHRARAEAGRFLLRIEDIDPARCRPEFEAAILEDLGLAGPRLGAAGPAPVRSPGRLSAARSTGCAVWASSIPASAAGRISPRRSAPRMGRRDRSIPAPAATCRPRWRGRGRSGAIPMRCGWMSQRPRAMTGPLTFQDEREGTVAAQPETLGRCRAGAAGRARQLSSVRHGRRPPAGRDFGHTRASICSTRPTFIGCCRRFWT